MKHVVIVLLFYLRLSVKLTSLSSTANIKKRSYTTSDGTTYMYDNQAHQWQIQKQPINEIKSNDKQTLAIEGRLYATNEYFPNLYTNKEILFHLSQVTNTNICDNNINKPQYDGTFYINSHQLYVGNMINNGLIGRSTKQEKDGDTGKSLWDTSIQMAKLFESINIKKRKTNIGHIAESMLNMRNKNVIEIGCGTGIVGLSIASLNIAKNIWLTDLQYCVPNIQINIEKNSFLWNQENMNRKNENNPFEDRTKAFQLDWNNPQNIMQSIFKDVDSNQNTKIFDVIIGSDIIWLKELVPILVNTLDFLFKNYCKENAVLIIGEQIRSKQVSELFWKLMRKKYFDKIKVHGSLLHPKFNHSQISIWIVFQR